MAAVGTTGRTMRDEGPSSPGRVVRIIEETTELAGLQPDWARMRTDVPGPTMHYGWIRAQADALPARQRLCAVCILRGGRLTALAPLVRAGPAGSHLHWLDTGDVSGALYADEGELSALARAIYALRRPLCVSALVPAGPTQRALLTARPRHWLQVDRTHLGGPSLPLDGDWSDPLARLSAKRRGELRRTRRKAEALGRVAFDARTPSPHDVDAELARYVALEASGWKGRAGTALAQQPQEREGLRGALTAAAHDGAARVTDLHIGDTLAGMHLSLVGDGGWWGVKGAIDDAFKPVAAGIHLFAYTISVAAAEGLDCFEFMGVTSQVKEMWGAPARPLHRHWLAPPTPSGAAMMGTEAASRLGARARHRWRTREEARSRR